MGIVSIINQTISCKVKQSMGPDNKENKGGKMEEKMEKALRYAQNLKIDSSQKPEPTPRRGSLRVVSQIKKNESLG
jgi:hypothetical protein